MNPHYCDFLLFCFFYCDLILLPRFQMFFFAAVFLQELVVFKEMSCFCTDSLSVCGAGFKFENGIFYPGSL